MKDRRHIGKNYILGIINGVLFNFVDSLTGPRTVMPVLLKTMTNSSFIIGLASAMPPALWFLPQIFTASFLEGMPYKKFMYIYTAYTRFFAMLLMALVIFWHPSFVLPLFISLLFIYSLSAGLAGVSFMDIVGKTIHPKKLPSFWAWRQFAGGILAALGGFFVKYILSTKEYPINYGLLFLISSVIVAIGLFAFSLSEEPPDTKQKKHESFNKFLKEGFEVFKKDTQFRCLFFFRILINIASAFNPFYILFALSRNLIKPYEAGYLITAQMLGTILSNILWNHISKKKSAREILIYNAVIYTIMPILIIFTPDIPLLIYLIFFAMGSTAAGVRVGYPSYLLTIATDEKRPTYIGFINTLTGPFFFFSMVNGFIIDKFSFYPAILLTIISGISATYIALKMKRPVEV